MILNLWLRIFLNVVIFPEQPRNLCQNCEKYFTIPVCRKRKAAAHSGGGQFLSSAVVIIVIGFKVKTRELLRICFCCSACGVEVSRYAVIVVECFPIQSVKVYHNVNRLSFFSDYIIPDNCDNAITKM